LAIFQLGTHGCQLVEIVPGVWTAHFEDMSDRDALQRLPIEPPIQLVVNSACVYDQCPTSTGHYGPDIQVLRIELFDDPKHGEPHTSASDARVHFDLVNNSIQSTLASGGSAIVHCYASLSRSVCLLIAYLMDVEHMSLLDATRHVKSKWDATWPNDSFVFQLIDYERTLRQRKQGVN